MLDINSIIKSLRNKRTILNSQIHLRDIMIENLEFFGLDCKANNKIGNDSVDIFALDNVKNKKYFFEVRYKKKKLEINVEGTEYILKNHGAQDQGRYDYIKDIEKLERIVEDRDNKEGYALMVTNDHYYWEPPHKDNSMDKDFLLYHGRTLNGLLKWNKQAAKGTINNRESSLQIKDQYLLEWNDYFNFSAENGKFQYLIVHVKGKTNNIEN